MVLDKPSESTKMTHPRFLVGYSRVEEGEHLRGLFPRDPVTNEICYDQCSYLTDLEPSDNLLAFIAGYSDGNMKGNRNVSVFSKWDKNKALCSL